MLSKLRAWIRKYHNHQFPRLKHVNSLLDLEVRSFGWFNLLLGAALFQRAAMTSGFFLLHGIFGYSFWGTYFFVGGVLLLIGQFFNLWTWMRWTLLGLLFSKFIWLSALSWRQIVFPNSNIFLLLFFGLATILQFGMYLFFPVYKKVDSWKR